MMRFQVLWLIPGLLLASALAAPGASAKDLHGRLGLGYNSQFGSASTGPMPGVSLRYAMTPDIVTQAVFALSTARPKQSATGLKVSKILFFENYLNFYFVLGGGLLTHESDSGAQFLSGFGAEFFIPGVDSLGLCFETGVQMDNLEGSFAFRTMGVNILNAGVHFYF